MSFIKVEINTSPIPEGVLEPKVFGFPSGGGGGGGGGATINEPNINANGNQAVVLPEVPAGAEVTLVDFNLNFVGGLKALMFGFLNLPPGSSIPTELRFYVDGALVGKANNAFGGNITWGFMLNNTPIGLKTCEMKLFSPNLPITPLAASAGIMEFLTA